MKKISNIIIGLVFIALGVIFGLNTLGYTNIDIFFDGWWTLILIIPCVVNLFTGKNPWVNLAGISVGSVALLICQGVITAKTVLSLIFPIALICVGVYIIFKDAFTGKIAKRIKELNGKYPSRRGVYATFSAQNISFSGEVFAGAELTAIVGSVKCDLFGATVPADCVINSSVAFGSICITLPHNVNVAIKSTPILGGVNKKRSFPEIPGAPTVYINAKSFLGGVELR